MAYQTATASLFSGMNTSTAAQSAHADQLAVDLRQRRCCDAFDPCDPCRVGRKVVAIIRRLESVPARPVLEVPSQRAGLDQRERMSR